MSIESFIIYMYCCIVDEYNAHVENPQMLRRKGYGPKLTDAEVITMEIVGEFLSIDTDKGIWSYFKCHWNDWFPNLGSRANFAKQSSHLWFVKQLILGRITNRLGTLMEAVHLVDGFPMPVCHFARANHCTLFKGEAQYGHCESKKQTYYGFQGQVLIGASGAITNFTLTAANVDERESLWDLTDSIHGLLIGDKGYISQFIKEQLAIQKIDLQTPLRSNMQDSRPKEFVKQLISTRRLVETVIGQLTQRFNIQKVWARDLWHLTNRITRKLLSHSMAILLNRSLGNNNLQFDRLIKL